MGYDMMWIDSFLERKSETGKGTGSWIQGHGR